MVAICLVMEVYFDFWWLSGCYFRWSQRRTDSGKESATIGVKYSAQESQELIQAMTNNLQVANEVTDRLSSGCDHLISSLDSGELAGAAYTAGKGVFTDIIIPCIKKLQAAIDDIQLELTSYKHADAQVSGYGDLDLD